MRHFSTWEPDPMELPVGPPVHKERTHSESEGQDADEQVIDRDRPPGSHVIVIDLA